MIYATWFQLYSALRKNIFFPILAQSKFYLNTGTVFHTHTHKNRKSTADNQNVIIILKKKQNTDVKHSLPYNPVKTPSLLFPH